MATQYWIKDWSSWPDGLYTRKRTWVGDPWRLIKVNNTLSWLDTGRLEAYEIPTDEPLKNNFSTEYFIDIYFIKL